MVASIQEFGFKIPVLARSSGEVVDGHLRLKAARKLGIAEVPVILCDEWSEAQVKAFQLMVNRSVGWAEWDNELLGLELSELKDLDFDLNLTGFHSTELERYLADTDAPPWFAPIQGIPEDAWIRGDTALPQVGTLSVFLSSICRRQGISAPPAALATLASTASRRSNSRRMFRMRGSP